MKLTIETKYSKVEIEVNHNDLTVGQVVENLFRPAMYGAQYSSGSLDKVIGKSVDDDILID